MTKIIKSKALISALFVALLCILLSVVIALPTSAEELTPSASGSCGENATWEYYESTGELKIFGSGEISDSFYRDDIKTVTIANGITSIQNGVFYGCSSLTSIEIPTSVTSIGDYAFYRCTSLTSIEIPAGVTSIGFQAFFNCRKLIEVYNLSNLDITCGSESNGEVGYYAKVIHTSKDEKHNREHRRIPICIF